MKRILVPIDFSTTAESALRYAVDFGKAFDAEVICLHAAADASVQPEMHLRLQHFISENTTNASTGMKFTNVVLTGGLEKAVNEYLGSTYVDLILMGTKGAAGFQKVVGGSHTTDLLDATSLPILIVPEGYVFHPIHKILLASDFKNVADSNALYAVLQTARIYDAEVRIAHVKLPGEHGSIHREMEAGREHHLFANEGVKNSLKKIKWTDISGGINYYLGLKGDNDMLVMVRRKHGFLSRAFRHDHTYEFACRPSLPLLVVHE